MQLSVRVGSLVGATAAGGDHCVLAARGESADEHVLILCNAIGSPVDSRWDWLAPGTIALGTERDTRLQPPS
jgi:hypothetical protein